MERYLRDSTLGLVLAALAATLFLFSVNPAAAQKSFEALKPAYQKAIGAGDFAGAERVAKRMVAIARKRNGRRHITYGLGHNNLALAVLNQGRYGDAIKSYKQALPIYEKTLGRSHAAVGDLLNNLANAHFNLGQPATAIPLYKRALKIYEKRLKADNPSIANTVGNLASAYYRQGSYREALPLLERNLELIENARGPAAAQTAGARERVADVLHLLGRFDESLSLFESALASYKQVIGPRTAAVANTYGNLANVNRSMGQYDKAISLMEKSRDIFIEVLGPRHENVGTTLNNLANIYKGLDNLPKAAKLYKQALEIYDARLSDDNVNLANTRENLASVYSDQGRFDEAVPLLERAIAIKKKALGPQHPRVADSYLNHAGALNLRGDFEDALTLYEKALKIYNKVYGKSHPQTALALDNIGTARVSLGQHAKAVSYHKRALDIREKTLGADHPAVLQSILNLANAHAAQSTFAKAIPLYERGRKIAEKTAGRTNPSIAKIFSQLAFVNQADGKPEKALVAARDAAKTVASLQKRSIASRSDTDDSRSQPLNHVYEQVVSIAFEVGGRKKAKREGLADEALAAAQRHGTTSVSAALSQMAARFGTDDKALGKVVREQQDLTTELQKIEKTLVAEFTKPANTRDPKVSAGLRRERSTVEKRLARLSARLEKKFPTYGELTNPAPLSIKNIRGLLAEDEALVVYLLMKGEGYVWAITDDALQWQKLPNAQSAESLSARVAGLRKGLDFEALQRQEDLFDLEKSHALYKDLLGPVEDVIADKRKLLIVPVGALTSLPFNVLVTDPPAQAVPPVMTGYQDVAWLVKRHAIAILPSVSSLRALRVFASKQTARDAFIGYGNPDFGGEGASEVRGTKVTALKTRAFSNFYKPGGQVDLRLLSASLSPLPDTADELRHVAERLGADGTKLRLGATATERDVKSARLENYRVVYFATHGLVAGDLEKLGSTAAEPALALTVPSTASDIDNGLLTASEVAQLKLNADWVVLSACNTAAGDKPGAEALSGLAKSFIYAGARALLVSHWPVVSSAAVTLTSQIFDARAKDANLGKAEALRRSMLALIADEKDPLNAYPAVWAPFIVVGD